MQRLRCVHSFVRSTLERGVCARCTQREIFSLPSNSYAHCVTLLLGQAGNKRAGRPCAVAARNIRHEVHVRRRQILIIGLSSSSAAAVRQQRPTACVTMLCEAKNSHRACLCMYRCALVCEPGRTAVCVHGGMLCIGSRNNTERRTETKGEAWRAITLSPKLRDAIMICWRAFRASDYVRRTVADFQQLRSTKSNSLGSKHFFCRDFVQLVAALPARR